MILILLALAYFMLIRPEKQKQKAHKELLANLKKSDHVVTVGGITGVVSSVRREADEVTGGSPKDAVRMGRGFLELRIEEAVPELDRPLLVMCAGGVRSLFAAETLKQLGYQDVKSVAGGFNRWKNNGLPFETPRVLDADARERYARHLLLPEIGEAGQLKLMASRVLLIGAGAVAGTFRRRRR